MVSRNIISQKLTSFNKVQSKVQSRVQSTVQSHFPVGPITLSYLAPQLEYILFALFRSDPKINIPHSIQISHAHKASNFFIAEKNYRNQEPCRNTRFKDPFVYWNVIACAWIAWFETVKN